MAVGGVGLVACVVLVNPSLAFIQSKRWHSRRLSGLHSRLGAAGVGGVVVVVGGHISTAAVDGTSSWSVVVVVVVVVRGGGGERAG